jgi:hypothetical protein
MPKSRRFTVVYAPIPMNAPCANTSSPAYPTMIFSPRMATATTNIWMTIVRDSTGMDSMTNGRSSGTGNPNSSAAHSMRHRTIPIRSV